MSLDDGTDALAATVATLAAHAARAELDDVLGETCVVGVYARPVAFDSLSALRLPAITAYRLRDRDDSDRWERPRELTTMRLEYYAPLAPMDRLDTRWPLLRSVWRAVQPAIKRGMHPSYAPALGVAGDNAYKTVEVEGYVYPTASARYMHAKETGSTEGYAALIAEFDLRCATGLSGGVPVEDLEPFDHVLMQYQWHRDSDAIDNIDWAPPPPSAPPSTLPPSTP